MHAGEDNNSDVGGSGFVGNHDEQASYDDKNNAETSDKVYFRSRIFFLIIIVVMILVPVVYVCHHNRVKICGKVQ